MKVLFLPEVELYLYELVELLYEQSYFSFEDQAVDYVERLKNYVERSISMAYKRNAPDVFVKYGEDMKYIVYEPNRQTSWYIFFQQRNDVYLVRYITNNHVSAQYFSY